MALCGPTGGGLNGPDARYRFSHGNHIVELLTESRPLAPRKPLTGPAALSSRRIGAAAFGRRGLGPLARPIPRLEPTVLSASPLASMPAAQPPPR